MSYRIEKTEIGSDIVIDGWEEGIIDDPYKGIYDMRNCDNVTIPGEVSVAMSTQSTYTQINLSNIDFTVDPSTEIFTWSGIGGTLTDNTAIRFSNSGGGLPAPLVNTGAYYVTVLSPTTFKVSLSVFGSVLNITSAGTGTNTFTVINMGTPVEIIGKDAIYQGYYYCVDNNGRVWTYLTGITTYWYYLNNLASEIVTDATNSSIVTWRGYLFLFYNGLPSNLQYVKIDTSTISLKSSWSLSWKPISIASPTHKAIVSINDDSIYFCNANYVGTLYYQTNAATNPSQIAFDPANPITYVYNDSILPLPKFEQATCLAELGSNLMVGGQSNYIYPWDRVSPNYTTPIFLSENYVTRMVTINTTMYIFCGYKGRIFVTNGANATPFFKVAEYLSNTTNPYIVWKDANFNRNQLYFGFSCTTNSGTTINEYGGLWAVDIDSVTPVAPRMQNQLSYGTYNGYVSAICQFRGTNNYNIPSSNDGYGLFIGWYDGSSVGGIDKGISAPYTGGQSYVICDPIPIGQYLTNKTLSGIEYKLGAPLVTNETVTIGYRTQLSGSFTDNALDTYVAGSLSQWGTVKFEKSQWVQLQLVLTSTATNPSYCRVREIRIHLS